jgi:methionyl aminopeptidase
MIPIKNAEEIARMKTAGKILTSVFSNIIAIAKEGKTGVELDRLARKLISAAGAAPSFLGYKPNGASRPYPNTLCVSINDTVVHGVPTGRTFKPGDLVKLDLGASYRGYHADAAVTLGIGALSQRAENLIRATRDALRAGTDEAGPGKTLGDIGAAVEKAALASGFSVIEGLTGHGIGKKLHENPTVLNTGTPGAGLRLKPGMAIAIEPMFSAGSPKVIQRSDDSYATADGSMSAHFEHTILITEKGAEILTVI